MKATINLALAQAILLATVAAVPNPPTTLITTASTTASTGINTIESTRSTTTAPIASISPGPIFCPVTPYTEGGACGCGGGGDNDGHAKRAVATAPPDKEQQDGTGSKTFPPYGQIPWQITEGLRDLELAAHEKVVAFRTLFIAKQFMGTNGPGGSLCHHAGPNDLDRVRQNAARAFRKAEDAWESAVTDAKDWDFKEAVIEPLIKTAPHWRDWFKNNLCPTNATAQAARSG